MIKKQFIQKIISTILLVLTALRTLSIETFLYAQPNSKSEMPNLIYTDSNISTGNFKTGTYILEGDATFLLDDVYITANKVIIQRNEGLVTAEGNVKLIYEKEKAVASRVIYDINTKQMRMDNAQIFSDPATVDKKYSEEALGLTKAEIAFDSAREARIQEIKNELNELRDKYVNIKNLENVKGENIAQLTEKSNGIVRRYGQLLARLYRTQYQPNAILAALPEEQREKFLARRQALEKFNLTHPDLTKQSSNFSSIQGYIKVAASQIIQKDPNTFILNNSIITPCHCSSYNEPPLFGFSTKNARIDVDNYITMEGVTLDIFSVPVFYSPLLIFPIKTQRTTGFLIPSAYMSNNAGQEFSIPFFVVLGPHADSTITYENFSQRGSQIDAELRAQLSDDSSVRTSGKFIQDKLYQSQWQSNSGLIDTQVATAPNADTAAMYESFRGKNAVNRGYADGSINIPVKTWAAFKANQQFVSDNLYLSDFSMNNLNVDPIATIFGDKSPASRRFLNQEFAAEYYGDNLTLSVRGQGLQDLFSPDRSHTPARMPRVELYLLPQRIFNTPFVFSNNTTFEHVSRSAGAYPVISSVMPTFISPTQNGNFILPGGQKTPNEPYLQGNRIFSNPTLTLPFPKNDYFNAYTSMTAVGTKYYFPSTPTTAATDPHLAYLQYKAHLDVPLFGTLNLKNDETKFGSITQNITPYIDINYLPTVIKSADYPNTYQLWYAQDSLTAGNAAPTANITVGASTSWTLQKEDFVPVPNKVTRLPEKDLPQIADLNFFTECVKEKGIKVTTDPAQIFQFSSENDAKEIFELWALKELNNYYAKVSAAEFRQNYIWPSGNNYEKRVTWSITPLTLSVSTGYNLMADQTASQIISSAGPTAAPVPQQRNLDLTGSAVVNFAPLLPMTATLDTVYSQTFHRLSSLSSGTNITLPYGLMLAYNYNIQYVINPFDQVNFIEKTQQSVNVTYTPLKWLQFGYQWARSVDPATLTDNSAGRGYASSQSISFLNFQDCFDLILARNKAAGIAENQATYAIGFNLKVFGYTRNYPQIGDYLNRKIQGSNANASN